MELLVIPQKEKKRKEEKEHIICLTLLLFARMGGCWSDSGWDPHVTLEGQVQKEYTAGLCRTKPGSDRAILNLWKQ